MRILAEASDIFSFQLFSPEECRAFLRELEGIKTWSPSLTRSASGIRLQPEFRKSHQIDIREAPLLRRGYRRAAASLIKPVVFLCWGENGLRDREKKSIIRYLPGGHFERHMDFHPGATPEVRVLTFICYLNDGFTGGRTRFPRQNRSVEPAAGKAILFPSGITHPHIGEEVLSGVKYVLVGWLR